MSKEITSVGYRITATVEPRTIQWKALAHGGVILNNDLRGLFSEKAPKSLRISPVSTIIAESSDMLSSVQGDMAAKMNKIHQLPSVTSDKVAKYFKQYDVMLKTSRDLMNQLGKTELIISEKNVMDLNDRMNNLSLGDVYKLKIQITRIEATPFSGSRKVTGTELYSKTRVQATAYFSCLEDVDARIEQILEILDSNSPIERTDAYSTHVKFILDPSRKDRVIISNPKIRTKVEPAIYKSIEPVSAPESVSEIAEAALKAKSDGLRSNLFG